MHRPLLPSDRELYVSLAKAFYSTDAVFQPIPEKHFNDTFDELMRSDVYTFCRILEYEGTPAGYALMSRTYSQEAGGMAVWIEEIYILPEYRGKGLGSQMLRIAIAEAVSAMGCDTVELMVLDCNKRAYRCYLALGFEDVPESTQTMDIHGTSWVRHKMKLHCR